MNLYEVVFFGSFLLTLGVSLVKVFNMLNGVELYDIRISFMLFIGVVMSWGIMLFTYILKYDDLLYMTLFKFTTGFFLLNVVFMVIELIKFITSAVEGQQRKRYDPRRLLDFRV